VVYRNYFAELKKGNIAPMYILYGEEDLLISSVVAAIGKALLGAGLAELNIDYLNGEEVTIGKLATVVETLPFGSPRRLVVVKNSPYFFSGRQGAKKDVRENLTLLLQQLPKTTCLVFLVKGKVDQRQKAVQLIKKQGRVWEFPYLRGKELVNWIMHRVQQKGAKISLNTSRYLADLWQYDLNRLNCELEKLVAYVGQGGEIQQKHIQLLVNMGYRENVFHLLDAAGKGKTKESLQLLQQMLANGEGPLLLLFLIAQRLRLLGTVKALRREGLSSREIGSELKQHPFVITKAIEQADNFSFAQLKRYLEECLWADRQLKGGQLEPSLVLELLLVKITSAE
jgi:DNA polymerase-3 subunit delta